MCGREGGYVMCVGARGREREGDKRDVCARELKGEEGG